MTPEAAARQKIDEQLVACATTVRTYRASRTAASHDVIVCKFLFSFDRPEES